MSIFCKKRKYIIPAVFVLSFFVFISHVYAQDPGPIANAVGGGTKWILEATVGNLANLLSYVLGWVTNKVVAMIIGFAQYSNFVDNAQVKEGWTVVRDICNMFFILILLFIAFAVILRLESYSIKKSLPKLLVMAVLINFSRTICGILIDLSQIIMLTFIGPITEGQGNFHNILQLNTMFDAIASADYKTLNLKDTVAYYILIVLFMLIAAVVLISILIAFVMRIVMFWIYIVLSPLAFLLMSFPGGQKYAGQYWGEFTRYLLNGPVLAFFLWLSLYTMGNLDTKQIGSAFPNAPISILQGPNFARFIMAIGMLVGGLTISAQIGGMGSKWGSDMVSKIKSGGIGVAKRVSGYDAVADRAKAYMAMRKSARDEKIRTDVAGFAEKVGTMKKKYIAEPTAAIGKAVWGNFGAKKSARLSRDIEQLKSRNAVIDSENISSSELIKEREERIKANNRKIEMGNTVLRGATNEGKRATFDGVDYEFKNGYWQNSIDNNVLSDNDFRNKVRGDVRKFEQERENSQSDISRISGDIQMKKAEKGLNDRFIDQMQTSKTKAEDRQEFWDKVGKTGLFAAGGVMGAVLGGAPGALYGSAVAGFGAPSIVNDLKNAGTKDLKYANTYQADQVNSNKDGMKDKETDKVRSEMDDPNNSLFKRMAAALELIARKETNPQEIKHIRERLLGGFGDKVKTNFESEVSRNVVGASKLFDYENYPENRNKVRDKFASASLNLDNLDSSTLQKCGQEIATGMKNPTFKRQYDGLSDAKKASVEDGLKNADTYQAREKLAKVLSIDDAFGDRQGEKKKFTKGLSIKDIQDILNDGSEKKRISLRNSITINGNLNSDALADDVFERLSKDIPASKTIRASLGINEKAKGKSKTIDEEEEDINNI